MRSLYRLIFGIVVIIAFIIGTSPAVAEHNADPRYPDTLIDRGYNKENCDNMSSKVTGKQAEWLGHVVGCLVEDKTGYVLIEEFKIRLLSREAAAELKELVEKYTLPDPVVDRKNVI
jgi:hypothetical protein|tara:strand:+ start:2001 stop:2351 length:351 start_codon:yes stop_codon:yes gene_type:complete